MLGYLKYNDDFEKTVGLNQLWFKESNVYAKNGFDIRKLYIIDQPNKKGSFSFCVPLKHIFGFCETYDKVMYGYQHELSLYRKQDSKDAVVSQLEKTVGEGKTTYLKMSDNGKVKLDSLTWFVPHVKPSLSLSLSLLISLSLGETLLLEPFDGKVYDLLPVFLPELWSCPSNHLCLAPIFWLVFLSLSFRLS